MGILALSLGVSCLHSLPNEEGGEGSAVWSISRRSPQQLTVDTQVNLRRLEI
jgi:hypothetical protein